MHRLSDFFGKLIAKKDGIALSEVTSQYIHEQREKKIYPSMIYSDRRDLKCYSRTQWGKIEKICEWALEPI